MTDASRTLVLELAVAVLVFAGAAVAGWLYLARVAGPPFHDYNNPDGRHFGPAVMWATGHGFGNPADSCVAPGLSEFLMKKQECWDSSRMPADARTSPIEGKFEADRLYIFFMVGVAWWLFGFSWAALNIPMALAYALTGILVYGICRLGMNRLLSLMGTVLFLSSPLVLFYLPSMRDFLRGPPILATVFVCGYLLSHRVSRRFFLLLALFLGVAIGIGVGFRQDAVICLPPALFALAVFARGTPAFRMRLRLLAVIFLLVAFYIPARPVLQMNKDTGGNNAFYLLQGFAYPATIGLHVKPSSYLPIYSTSDFVVHGAICAYADATHEKNTPQERAGRQEYHPAQYLGAYLRWLGMATFPAAPVVGSFLFLGGRLFVPQPPEELAIWSDQAEIMGRDMLKDLVTTIPADIITRWYSATVISLQNTISNDFSQFGMVDPNPVLTALVRLHQPIADHLEGWGVWYGFAALLLLGAVDARLALACLAILVYFCGYVSLCFHWRHALHLQFIAFWPPCFLIGRCIAAGRGAWRLAARRQWRKWLKDAPHRTTSSLKGAVLFVAGAALLLVSPLYGARLWQHNTMQGVIDCYMNAQLQPIDWHQEVESSEDGEAPFVVYRPTYIPGLKCPPETEWASVLDFFGVSTEPCVGLHTEYLMAEFATSNPGVFVRLRYEDTNANLDIFHGYALPPGEIGQPQRYFFPVHEFTDSFCEQHRPAVLAPFKGFSLPSEAKLLGLYRVTNREDYPIAMNVWLPSNREAFRWFLGMAPFTKTPK